ncbi:MAG: winged helix-turn-helix domain-containing protein [Myxococcota bacterium]
MIFTFGNFEVDEELFELRTNGAAIPVAPRAFDTLSFLIRNRHRVVSKSELVAGPWRGAAVSDGALRQAIMQLRRALGDEPTSRRIIETVRGRGFRFREGVTERPSEDVLDRCG